MQAQQIRRDSTYQDVLGLIAVLSEVQIVTDEVRLVRSELNLHIELTPSFFLDAEGRVLEDCIECTISQTRLARTRRGKG